MRTVQWIPLIVGHVLQVAGHSGRISAHVPGQGELPPSLLLHRAAPEVLPDGGAAGGKDSSAARGSSAFCPALDTDALSLCLQIVHCALGKSPGGRPQLQCCVSV